MRLTRTLTHTAEGTAALGNTAVATVSLAGTYCSTVLQLGQTSILGHPEIFLHASKDGMIQKKIGPMKTLSARYMYSAHAVWSAARSE